MNYDEMARRALGAPWMEINALERKEFVVLFVESLRDMLAGRINDYSSKQLVYLSEQREGNVAEVRVIWIGLKVDTSFNVRLAKQAGNRLMYDAVIDGRALSRTTGHSLPELSVMSRAPAHEPDETEDRDCEIV